MDIMDPIIIIDVYIYKANIIIRELYLCVWVEDYIFEHWALSYFAKTLVLRFTHCRFRQKRKKVQPSFPLKYIYFFEEEVSAKYYYLFVR